MMTTNQLAAATGRNATWLRSQAKEGNGLCRKLGRDWVWDDKAVAYFRSLPETRGRKKNENI